MSLLSGLVRAALPVGSARRDALVSAARRVGVLPAPIPSSYQRWIESFESAVIDAPDPGTASIGFRVVVHPGVDSPSALTRTLVSLVNQSFDAWVAHLPDPAGLSRQSRRVLNDSLRAERRFTLSAASSSIPVVSTHTTAAFEPCRRVMTLHLDVGDSLAADALVAAAVMATRNPTATVLTGEFDMIDPFTLRRSAPAAVGRWEPDLADQFDLGSGCLFRAESVGAATDEPRDRLSSERPGVADALAGPVPHIESIVLHRLVGARGRSMSLLRPAPATAPDARPSTRRNGGTRLRHRVSPGTTACLVIRDPLADPTQASDQLSALLRSEVVQTIPWQFQHSFPDVPDCDFAVVIDGGLAPSETNWLGDLLGALDRPHVFAVAPVVSVPSGIVLDGGVVTGPDGMAARSGRADLAPFELDRCRQVPTLSGRALAIRRRDLLSMLDALQAGNTPVGAGVSGFSAILGQAARDSGRCCLIWAHQRWTLNRGIAAGPTDSPMLAWENGRIRTWFDAGVAPHRPEPGRAGEGVW
jgi:hypothetical protein